MRSVTDIIPLELDNKQIDFIKKHYIFLKPLTDIEAKKYYIKTLIFHINKSKKLSEEILLDKKNTCVLVNKYLDDIKDIKINKESLKRINDNFKSLIYECKNMPHNMIKIEKYINLLNEYIISLERKLNKISSTKNLENDSKNIIIKIDEDITARMKLLQGIDMANASNNIIEQMGILIKNILFINNIDYNDSKKLNYRVRGIEKWLKLTHVYGSGAEGTIYKINIHFGDLISPDLAMKIKRDGASPTELLKEFLNYYLIGYLKDFTPNFIEAFGLVTCNTNKGFINDIAYLNSVVLCSCVGTRECYQKNYMIYKPYKGETFEHLLQSSINKADNSQLILSNLKNILLQICYSLKIAQEKLLFLHNDLNDRNISLTIYDEPVTLTYIFNDMSQKTITSNVKVNIFDFGNSSISKYDFLETKDMVAITEYRRNFEPTNNIVGDMLKEFKQMVDNNIKNAMKENLRKKLYNSSNIAAIVSYEDALDYGMIGDNEILGNIADNFNEDINNYVKNIQNIFDETKDIKNLINSCLTVTNFSSMELKTKLLEYQTILAPLDTINQVISSIEMKQKGGSIFNSLKTVLESFKLEDIQPIIDINNNIDIDGYDSSLYGMNPIFNYMDITKEIDFYNSYGDITNGTCNNKQIYWGNPGYTKFFTDVYPINYVDKKPSELLPKPINVNDMTSFTYSFVIDKYTEFISVRYGRIENLTEIGANHAIISYSDKIIVSGEIAIVKTDTGFIYYINNNSSKMTPSNSKINQNNKHDNTIETDNFYYILIINLTLRLFQAIDPDNADNIKISKNTKIKYGTQFDRRLYTGDDIVKYYSSKECPTDDFIEKFNKFGKEHKIMNACMGYKDGDKIQNMHTVKIGSKDILKCEWDNGKLEDKYYSKYLKYKNKFLNLRKQIEEFNIIQ